MRNSVWAIAAIAVAALVVTAGVLIWITRDDVPTDGDDEPKLMEGVVVEATGPPNLTAYGLLMIPLNVTNTRAESIDFRAMNITLMLSNGSNMRATCNGPESVASQATEQFLLIVNSDHMLNITTVHVAKGREYLSIPVPRPSENQNGGGSATKDEPFVGTSLRSGRSFSSDPSPPYLLTYGVPVEGTLDTWVEERANGTRIGILVYFVGLSNDEVYVNASYGSGEPQWTNLYDDGSDGCFGMFITDQSNIDGDQGWTWAYVPSDRPVYYNITLSVTTYALGAHEVRFYAYDQDTGEQISDVEITNYTVLGTGGKFNDQNYLFDTEVTSDLSSTFVPGSSYHFNFTDSCRFPQYGGDVRSVLAFPYAERVWVVNGDESTTELTKGGDGTYTYVWSYAKGASDHFVHLKVQIGTAGTPAANYPYSVAFYHLEDVKTGLVMSHVGGDSHPGARIELRAA